MARRRSKRRKARGEAAESEAVDEREWKDWWELRAELGKRLGGRDASGHSDPEILVAARINEEKRSRRR